MDIKTRLEDDTVLLCRPTKHKSENTKIIRNLNKRGVFTIEDLINYDLKKIISGIRPIFMSMIDVYRHEYLEEPLVLEVLFDKEYEHSFEGYKESFKDLRKLGLISLGNWDRIYTLISHFDGKVIEDKTKPNHQLVGVIVSPKYVDKKFNLQPLLEVDNYIVKNDAVDLRGYYLEYLEKKKNQSQCNIKSNEADILAELKKQLQFLISMRDNIDEQINLIQKELKENDRGENKNVRK